MNIHEHVLHNFFTSSTEIYAICFLPFMDKFKQQCEHHHSCYTSVHLAVEGFPNLAISTWRARVMLPTHQLARGLGL